MLTVVKSYLRLFARYFKFNLSSAMEYRVSFFTQVIGMMINNAFLIIFWWVLFSRFKSIAGYTVQDMMFLWAVATTSFGITFTLFGNVWHLSKVIMEGNLDSYLLQPKDVYFNILMSKSLVGSWGDFTFGWILFFITFGFDPQKILLFSAFTVLGSVLMVASITAVGTLAFFMGNASALGDLMIAFISQFTTYPESIYKGWVRYLIYSIVPAGFIVFMPLKLLKSFSWSEFVILLIIDIFYFLASYRFFRFGLRKYESGNLITTKL